MAGFYLLLLAASLLLEVIGLPVQENTGGLYLTREAASTVLVRRRRYNSGHLEEMLSKDNLERECIEELCSMEEAREWFEDDEKTLEFWAGYQDGDQCKPLPCLNGGACEDGISSYVCWCKPDFSGKNCEIEVFKQCSVNNGGCSHFCVMKKDVVVCRCAAGYHLAADRKTCEPREQFSCGRVYLSPGSASTARHRRSLLLTPDAGSDGDPGYDYSDLNETELLYDYDGSHLVNSTLNLRSARTQMASAGEDSDLQPTFFPTWEYFAELPNVTAKENLDQRIVGGEEAFPGQLPWQVALMTRSPTQQWAQPFCGGSLVSDTWVITAAHCVVSISTQNFFVRAGEHDVKAADATERDHAVAEKHLHFMYNPNRSKYDHDIALLRLATPVELSPYRSPICLGPKSFIEELVRTSTTSMVSGWGRIKFNGLEATRLQTLEVPYVERTACKQSSRDHVTIYMFCAGFQTEVKDACQGDSGGPHATQYKGTWFLTGIVSWGEECAKDGKYGIYTRVSRYFPWISKTTGIRIN